MIITPYENASLIEILKDLKSAAVHKINRVLGRTGSLWQRESFDRIVRSDENLRRKREYIINNPVRAGLVSSWDDYPWTWFSR